MIRSTQGWGLARLERSQGGTDLGRGLQGVPAYLYLTTETPGMGH